MGSRSRGHRSIPAMRLADYGVNRYVRPAPLSAEARARARSRNAKRYPRKHRRYLAHAAAAGHGVRKNAPNGQFPLEPEENLLYFVEKHSPRAAPWQREIVRIVRKTGPVLLSAGPDQAHERRLGHVLALHAAQSAVRKGAGGRWFMLEFLQPPYQRGYAARIDQNGYRRMNPYALGFAMFSDIRRICEHPTDEDRAWFPESAGSDWRKTLDSAMRNFKDESFIGAVPVAAPDPRIPSCSWWPIMSARPSWKSTASTMSMATRVRADARRSVETSARISFRQIQVTRYER